MTLTCAEEAIGITRAARRHRLPCVISFTLETDGRLPSGQSLRTAIEQVDDEAGPDFYMINCAHPTHFAHVLDGGPWVNRIGGLRANASTKSHAELDEATTLDAGDPAGPRAALRRPRRSRACASLVAAAEPVTAMWRRSPRLCMATTLRSAARAEVA